MDKYFPCISIYW